jgi:site-specific recombinase XerD
MTYQELITQWEAQATPTKNQSKRVRSALCRLADAACAADWQSMTVLSREVAIDHVAAHVRPPRYTTTSRLTYLSNLRLMYDWAERHGVIDRDGQSNDDHWPIVSDQPWASTIDRRQRNAYDHWRRFALAKRISKKTVRSDDLLGWLEHQRVELGDRHYRKQFTRLCDAWPILVEHAGVADIALPELPSKKSQPYALKVEDWTNAIRGEWEAICEQATSRWKHEGRWPWRPKTVQQYTNLVARILGWAKATDRLSELGSLAMVLSPQTVQDYLDWLVQRTGRQLLNLGHGAIIRAARSITALYLNPPKEVMDEFKRMQREQLAAVVDKALLIFPYHELEQAIGKAIADIDKAEKLHRAGRISDQELAARYVDAIILTLLVTRGLRSANVRMIRLDKHVIRRGDEVFLRFDTTEMKNHIDFETTVPPILRNAWDRFVQEIRPKVATAQGGSQLLFARSGAPFSAGTFGQRVRAIGWKYLGRDVQPHLYRHLLACHIARDLRLDPATLQRMMGHRSLATTFMYYAPVSPAEAAAMVDEAFGSKNQDISPRCEKDRRVA